VRPETGPRRKGSAANAEGQIFIEPQGMCVMSGVGIDDGMAVRALDSVRERLATSHGILLLQPGLRVDPVLPAAWAGFTATRRFRGAIHQISVRNPDRASGRVTHLEVQGQRIEGTLVPLAPAGTTVHVEAVIRAGAR
jgi:cellobiose phosphorylase